MTPKEKAQELYSKYEFVYIQNYTSKHEVKQCALILIDEVLSVLPDTLIDEQEECRFWEQVRAEIQIL